MIDFADRLVAREMLEARNISYTAANDTQNMCLCADEMKRNGNMQAAQMLVNAAHAIARANKITAMAARTVARATRGKRIKSKIATDRTRFVTNGTRV